MVLWGLCGWVEGDRLVTTADQAGTTAIRKTFADLGYSYKYVYDIVGLPSRVDKVKTFCIAASAAAKLRHARSGMAGYRDMNLYGTQADGPSLKRVIGPEIECFEVLELEQRYQICFSSPVIASTGQLRLHFVQPTQSSVMVKV